MSPGTTLRLMRDTALLRILIVAAACAPSAVLAQPPVVLQPGQSVTITAAPQVVIHDTVWRDTSHVTPPVVVDTTPATPPPSSGANVVSNASFETGWDGFGNWSGCGSGLNPTGVSRVIDATAPSGQYVVRRSWTPNQPETGAQFVPCFSNADRVWVRLSVKLTAGINSVMKFARTLDNRGGVGGLFIENNARIFSWAWDYEDQSIATGIGLTDAMVRDGKYHVIEFDYQRNGDPSGFPAVSFWWDGKPLCMRDGTIDIHWSDSGNKSYWKSCRLYAGERTYGGKVSNLELEATLNASPGTTGSVSVDNISVDTRGRP